MLSIFFNSCNILWSGLTGHSSVKAGLQTCLSHTKCRVSAMQAGSILRNRNWKDLLLVIRFSEQFFSN